MAKIQHRLFFLRHGIHNFLVQATRFFDLPIGIARKRVQTLFGEQPFRPQLRQQRVAIQQGMRRRAQQFQNIRVAAMQQSHKLAPLVIHHIVAGIIQLLYRIEGIKIGFGQHKHAFDVGV